MDRDAYERALGRRENQEVAGQVGIHPSYLSKIISDKVTPSVALARRIADAVGASLDDLWPPESPQPRNPRPPRRSLRAVNPTASALGRAGGRAAQAGKTAAELSDLGKRLAAARWGVIPTNNGNAMGGGNAANDGSAYAPRTDALRILARTTSDGSGARA